MTRGSGGWPAHLGSVPRAGGVESGMVHLWRASLRCGGSAPGTPGIYRFGPPAWSFGGGPLHGNSTVFRQVGDRLAASFDVLQPWPLRSLNQVEPSPGEVDLSSGNGGGMSKPPQRKGAGMTRPLPLRVALARCSGRIPALPYPPSRCIQFIDSSDHWTKTPLCLGP